MVETGKKKKWKAMLFLLHSLSLVQRLNKSEAKKLTQTKLPQVSTVVLTIKHGERLFSPGEDIETQRVYCLPSTLQCK